MEEYVIRAALIGTLSNGTDNRTAPAEHFSFARVRRDATGMVQMAHYAGDEIDGDLGGRDRNDRSDARTGILYGIRSKILK